MNIATGIIAAAGTATLVTFALIRVDKARRLTGTIAMMGMWRSFWAFLPALIAFGGSEAVAAWANPVYRGIVCGFAGYGVMPGVANLTTIPVLSKISNDIDRRIREHASFDDIWLTRRDGTRLCQSYSVRGIILIYEQTLVFVVKLPESVARNRAGILAQLVDDSSVDLELQMSSVLRTIKEWGNDDWPEGLDVDGLILSWRLHGRGRAFQNRCRALLRKDRILIEADGSKTA